MEIPDATEKIKKGEQVRLLFELLMEKLGGNFEESRGQFFERLKTCFEEHEEAINVFKHQIKINKDVDNHVKNELKKRSTPELAQENGIKTKTVKTQ